MRFKRNLTRLLAVASTLVLACNIISGCSYNSDSNDSESKLFQDFIDNKATIRDSITGKNETMAEMLETDSGWYYFCDINGDGDDELCIKSLSVLYIIDDASDKLAVIYTGDVSQYPVGGSQYHGVMEISISGGLYTSQFYSFISIDTKGKTDTTITYSWIDTNGNGYIDEPDNFVVGSVGYSMEEWQEITKPYTDLDVTSTQWTAWSSPSSEN